ncbi:unnamed protein product [Penicillium nalgiovense]|nr:unnamed protein product [Penicillium nalgiovense]
MEIQVDHVLPSKALGESQHININDLEHIPIELPELTTFCDKNCVPLPRLLQFVWGAVLRTYTGSNDISFRCFFPGPTGSQQSWNEDVCHLEMAQDISAMNLLKDKKTQNWSREVRNHDLERCDTLLCWRAGSTDLSQLFQQFDTTKIRIFVMFEHRADGVQAVMRYWKPRVGELQAKGMAAAITLVAKTIIEQSFATLSKIDMCGENDVQFLQKWNSIEPLWKDECVHEAISRWSSKSPERLAVSAWDGKLTYGDLERLSSKLADYLVKLGVGPDHFVALCFEKSKWLIVSILGVIKAGGAYVLLEPAYTKDRMQNICDELKVTIIVASESLTPTAKSLSSSVVAFGENSKFMRKSLCKSQHKPANLAKPHNALYGVFTSGSTGKPKAIIVEHGAFHSWGLATANSICLDSNARVLQFSSFAFLVAHRDVLLTLIFGACICVPSEKDRLNNLETFMTEHQVNWANLTPSVAALLIPAKVRDLKTLVFTGEPMSITSLTIWSEKVNLIYAYGQAESVSISSVRKNPRLDEDRMNMGHRVGKAIWLVDLEDHDKLVPVGAVGELIVEGPAIARGYTDQVKTAQAFLRDTAWLRRLRPPGYRTRLYKTGDLAQYNDDGSLRFLCRRDNAVKLHGQRVELDEVERHVRRCIADMSDTGIQDVVVDLSSLEENLKLTVFLGFGHTSPQANGDIILGPLDQAPVYLEDLGSRLEQDEVPRSMIPTLLIPLSRIPLNPSGKTDRKRLRQIVSDMTPEEAAWCTGSNNSAFEVAQNKEELSLQKQWSRVLNVAASSIGRNDNFFRRGGNSFAAMKLAALSQDTSSLLNFSEIFLHPTLCAQARLVGGRTSEQFNYSSEPFELISGEDEHQELLKLSMNECSLSKSQIEDIYPTTPMQAGLIALTTLWPGTYISQRVYEIQNDVSLATLEGAWKAVFDANPPLRTRIIQRPDGGTFQVVVRGSFDFKILDHGLDDYLQQDKALSMQMGQQLARLAVVRGESGQPNVCVFTVHHCVYDAWTIPLLLEQVNAAFNGQTLSHRPFSPFVSYVTRSNQNAANHWTAEFSGLEADAFPPLPNPAYIPTATRSEQLEISLPPNTNGNNGITLSNRIGLAWALTIARYTASNDVVFGLTVSGRGAPVSGIDKVAGPTIATIPLRMQLRSTVSIQDELQTLQDRLVATLPFEQYGLQNIRKLGEEAERACQFQSLLVVQQNLQQPVVGILRNSPVGNGRPILDTYALALLCTPAQGGDSVSLEAIFDETVIPEAQLKRLLKLFAHLLAQVNLSPEQSIREIDGIDAEDLEQLQVWNGQLPSPSQLGIINLIKQHGLTQPEATAIDAWDGSFSYSELNKLSSTLAITLAEHGVRPDTFVPLCIEKSKWVAVAILAVLKSGGAFILLDTSHPTERLRVICQDSQASVIICSEGQVHTAYQLSCRHVVPVGTQRGQQMTKLSGHTNGQSVQTVHGKNALCAVFTSGSTGKPKGIILEHAAVTTNAMLTGPAFQLNQKSRVFQFASHAFDVAIADYLFTLVWGGCVCVPNETASQDDLAKAMHELDANWSFLTPSVARTLDPNSVPKLKSLVLGGEGAKQVDIDTWSERLRLINLYGPAECAVYGILQTKVQKGSNPSNVGHTVAAACWLVVPDNLDQLAPIGSIGEVLFEGPIVGRGYIGHPENSKSSPFIPYPKWLRALRSENEAAGRLYQTGDLARYSSNNDGSIEIVGRKDQQIKLRGQRIELGEIEYQVAQQISCAADTVVDIITPSHLKTPMLVAFIKSNQRFATEDTESSLFPTPNVQFQAEVTQTELALRSALPRHMVPTVFILLGYLPLTPNGKANRRLLKEKASLLSRQQLDAYRTASTHVKTLPLTPLEHKLHSLMSGILHFDSNDIGMDDNFFHLGGDSISAMAMAAQARRAGLNLGMVDILTNPRLSALAALVTKKSTSAFDDNTDLDKSGGGLAPFSLISSWNNYDKIVQEIMAQCGLVKEQIEDIYPCTPVQEGLFALTMHQPEAYVWRLVLELSEGMNVVRFQDAWNSVYQANPILRTRITSVGSDGQLFQVVARSKIVWSSSDELLVRPGAPLFNIRILDPHDNEDLQHAQVVLTLHHAIYDDVSIKSILAQLEEAYNGATLNPRLYSPFVDHCSSLATTQHQEVADFWNGELAGVTSAAFPAVPADEYILQASQSLVHEFPFRFDPRVGTPLASVVHLAWGMVVSHFTGERDVVFGTVVSGRAAMLEDIDQISGPTIATVPFRVRHEPDWTVQEALDKVQSSRARMVPFEQTGLQRIGQIVNPEACRFRNLLVIQAPGDELVPANPLFSQVQNKTPRGTFDTYPLTVTCTPMPDSVMLQAEFDESLIKTAMMRRILTHFAHLLTHLTATWRAPISDIPSISVSDLAQLQAWNEKLPPVVEENFCVHELIQRSGAKSPKAPAICAWDGDLSYEQLDGFSSLLETELLSLMLDPKSIVPIYFEPSKWTSVAVLAVMKAGRPFLLLDSGHPTQRLREICQLVEPSVILSSKSMASRAALLAPVPIITVDGDAASWKRRQICVLDSPVKRTTVTPDDCVYVVFTSGSTGHPKGIVISHRAFSSMAMAYSRAIGVGPNTRGFSFASYAFDVSITDMLDPLIAGGCVCVPSSIDRTGNLAEAIRQLRANFIEITPSMLRTVRPDEVPSLKTIVVSGEPLNRDIIDIWASKVHLIQAYGPAECCPNSTVRTELTVNSDPSNIGVGTGCWLWIVDPTDHEQLAPIGAVGELLVEGPIVGSGYLNNPEKTAASFVRSPRWAKTSPGASMQTRFYKTGDLVRYDEDGSLIFQGRKDTQLKIRGQRVEIAEIEYHLAQLFPLAAGSAVELLQSKTNKSQELVAFIFCGDEIWKRLNAKNPAGLLPLLGALPTIKSVSDIKAQLGEVLPRYMVPIRYQMWAFMPTSLSAKLNRQRLQAELQNPSASTTVIELHEPTSGFQMIDPTNLTALRLNKKILSRVQSETRTALIDRDFPLSMLGLDSIQLIILVTFIRNEFNVKVAVATLYDPRLTVAGLAAMISSSQQGQNGGAEVSLPVIDLSSEIKDIYHQFNRQSKSLRLRKRIFLTGATGLLGSQTLRQLLDDPSVDKVVVHVRAPTAEEALKRVVSTATLAQWWSSSYLGRIECVSGDLSAPHLGLQPEKWRMLCNIGVRPENRITAIVHNGAAVHWQAPYQSLKPVNVDSTVDLLAALDQWDQPGSFTFISGGLQRAPTQDIQSFIEVLQRSNGYSQTKFVAEELVSMFASRQSKNHVSIVRPGLIIGTEKEGIPNIDDFQWKLVQVCLRMGSYPMEEGNLWLAVADVEEVATTILKSAFETTQQNATTPSFVDVETGSTVSQFWNIVQETTSIKLKSMKPEPWKEAADGFLESDDLFRPLLAIVQDLQQGFGLHKPEIAETLRPGVIKRNVQTLVDIGFLPTAHSRGIFNLSGLTKAGNMAAFNRSRRQ